MESLCGRGGAEILVCFSVFLKQPLGCFFQSDRSCTRTLFLFFFVENDIIETDERNEKGGIPLANKETIQEIVLVIIGNLVLALGVTVFILPNDVLTGGLTGIAVALEPVIHVEPTLVINVMTVALFFVGWLFLGRRFALKTLVSTICYPLFLSLLAWVVDTQFPENYFIMDRYLATIYGGILMGCGVGLIFRCGASSGGMDIPPLVLHKFTHIPLATLVLITDTLTVLLGVATYGFQAALVGIISVFLSSVAIDKMLTLGAACAPGQTAVNYERLRNGVLHHIAKLVWVKLAHSTQPCQAAGLAAVGRNVRDEHGRLPAQRRDLPGRQPVGRIAADIGMIQPLFYGQVQNHRSKFTSPRIPPQQPDRMHEGPGEGKGSVLMFHDDLVFTL